MRLLPILVLLASTSAVASNATVDDLLNVSADRNGVPRNIVHAVATVESTKQCGAKNGGSRGIMQVQRGAAREVGIEWPFKTCEDEIEAGVRYLKKALDKGGYDCVGITLYNTGLYGRQHCSAYGRKVLREMR